MRLLRRYCILIDTISDRVGVFAEWMVLLACLVSAGNATVRYAFNQSSNAWLELQWYMFAAMFLLGASQTLRMNEHVRVDLFYGMMSRRSKLWVDVFGIIVFLLPATSLLSLLTLQFFLTSFHQGEMSMNAGGLLVWPAKLIMPLGFSLLTLQGVSELIKRIGGLTGHIDYDPDYVKPLQ